MKLLLGLIVLLSVVAVFLAAFEVWSQRRKPHKFCAGQGCRFCDNGRVFRSALLRSRARRK